MSANDRKWEAERDASSLARAAEVQADAVRMRAAQAAIKRMAADKEKELAGMKMAISATKSTSIPKTKAKPVAARKRY